MREFWRDRRVFLTGHTGFKGAWMSLWLHQMGAKVTGYSLAPHTDPSLFDLVGVKSTSHIGDIRDDTKIREALIGSDPQVIIHMAAQALVRESYRDPVATYSTNVLGTGILLQACRTLKHVECVLVVTSDKVYENHDEGRPFIESDRLGGHDPYSNSKACAELLTGSFRDSFFGDGPPIASVRAGNVIGGGDWSQDRLIPDCVRALAANEPVTLRFPDAVRPWQHVLEPLCGYLALAQALVRTPASVPRAVNFGPNPSSFCKVHEVVDAFSARFSGRPGWRRDAGVNPREAAALTLSSALAHSSLQWGPRLGIGETLAWTADWYEAYAAGEDMVKFSEAQIVQYQSLPALPA
ncbi:MAG: CDP-glucose 4,6-dehydratase [Pseudomonadota bacterium]|nr:CDP-glucose 4,6-dehydratase [Pseudomonadota bacterium]